MTHRQFVAFNKWLDEQEFIPSRADTYVMQIALEVHRIGYMFSKTPPSLKLKDFRLVRATDKQAPLATSGPAPVNGPASLTEADLARIALEKVALKQMFGFGKARAASKPPAYKQTPSRNQKQKIKYPPRSR
jgi:hypothetical protein